jgi:TPR repeat protein
MDRLAAGKGFAIAQLNLGILYEDGLGVTNVTKRQQHGTVVRRIKVLLRAKPH